MKLDIRQWINLFEREGITKEDLENDSVCAFSDVADPIVFVPRRHHIEQGFPSEGVYENYMIIMPSDYEYQPDGKVWSDAEWKEIERIYDITHTQPECKEAIALRDQLRSFQ